MGLYPRHAVEYAIQAGVPRGRDSKVFVVDPTHGDDDNNGLSFEKPLATLEAAEDLCTTNHNDTVLYVAGSTGLTPAVTAALAWDKSYTHLVGLAAPTHAGQRARIFAPAAYAATPFITVSGSGCVFKDLYIFDGVAHAESLVNVKVTGGRNYFENVHFAGGGNASNAIDGGASLLLDGAEECLFNKCTIGVDTVPALTGMMGVLVDGDAKRIVFRDCMFTMYAGHAGCGFVEVVDNTGFDRYLLFDKCLFLNDAVGYTMTSGFVIPTGMGSATHRIILKDCMAVGMADWDASNRGLIYLNTGTTTGGGNAGIGVVANAT